jgi:hypothetical protein
MTAALSAAAPRPPARARGLARTTQQGAAPHLRLRAGQGSQLGRSLVGTGR